MTPSTPDGARPPPLAASAIIAFGTVVSLAAGVAANKVYAVVLGPSGVGVIALVLSIITIGGLVGTVGLGTSVAQLVSAKPAGVPTSVVESTARRLTLGLAGGLAVGLFVLREDLAIWIFGTASAGPYLALVIPSVAAMSLIYLETGILTGHERIRSIAGLNAFAAITSMLVGIFAVVAFGLLGFVLGAALAAATHLIAVRVTTYRVHSGRHAATGWDQHVARRLVQLGFAACMSQLAAVGSVLVVPILILRVSGSHDVGLYRAASVISVAYLTLFLSTLSYEYLPRIARLQSHELGAAVDDHMRLLLGTAVPLILALFALGPVLIVVLFSEAFSGAIAVLQWQLVGDLLRLPAWALAYALLARSRGGYYLGLEATAGLALIVAVPVGLTLGGLDGVGIGYAVAQVVYLAAAWILASRLGITAPGRLQAAVVAFAIVTAVSIVVEMSLLARGITFGAVALGVAALAFPRLYRLYRTGAI